MLFNLNDTVKINGSSTTYLIVGKRPANARDFGGKNQYLVIFNSTLICTQEPENVLTKVDENFEFRYALLDYRLDLYRDHLKRYTAEGFEMLTLDQIQSIKIKD